MKRFRGLRTRLTLTYMLVTVGAMLSLLIVLLAGLFTLITVSDALDTVYLDDVQIVLGSQIERYLEEGDLVRLEQWMDDRFVTGMASDPPTGVLDSPMASFANGSDYYVTDAAGVVLAQSPGREAIGRFLPLPATLDTTWFEQRAATPPADLSDNRHILPNGEWFVLIPLDWSENELSGFLALTVEPAPSLFRSYFSLFVMVVGSATLVLLIGVAPFGALFGYLMARNLTERLARIEASADAWSRGEFEAVSEETSGDEIGRLANRLQRMAQEIDVLLQNRQAVALLEERNRLARELHDTVKQQNFATLMQLRAAKNLAEQDRDADVALGHLESAENLLKQSQQDLKNVIEELRPTQLDGIGLAAALQKFVADWSRQAEIPVAVTIEQARELPLSAEQALYRIAQEAFSNIARHSNANTAAVELRFDAQRVMLTISDDGIGLDTTTQQSGFGLSTMRQRVTALDGTLTVNAGKMGGVEISAELPF